MKIIDLEKEINEDLPVGIALGNFDGLHLGHIGLIEKMMDGSKKRGLKSSLLLFTNHTKTMINKKGPKMLTNNEQKIKIAEEIGIDVVFTMEFTEDIMKLSEVEFIETILRDKINAQYLFVGFDYRYGHKAKGTASSLKELGENYGMETDILRPVAFKEEVVSSTVIRDLIQEGRIREANKILGRDFSMIGRVVEGKRRGRTLGFPTANLEVDEDYIIPRDGVYKTETLVDGIRYRSITDIGNNPTFEAAHLKIETHILDFDQDIYGKKIEVFYQDFLRPDLKFNSKEELIEQMEKDINSIL